MKVEINSKKLRSSFVIILLALISGMMTFSNIQYSNTQNYPKLMNNPFSFKNPEFHLQQADSSIQQGFEGEYIQITNINDTGSTFSVKDVVTVNDDENLNLTYNSGNGLFEDSFSINPVSGYSTYSLNFNFSSITAKPDWYPVESNTDGTVFEIGYNEDRIAVAQAFEVKWDYALFMGSKIYLDYEGNTGAQNLELIIVKADEISGYPNMSYEYTNDINDPYNNVNQIPFSTIDNLVFYNFTDTVLDRGTYFIVANITNPESAAKNFWWYGNTLGDDDGATYYRSNSGVWSSISMDLTCIPFLMPSNEFGDPLEITNPSDIVLQDNGEDIITLDNPISSIGGHTITSDTSLEITFNNSYSFAHDHIAVSSYQAFNSTFNDYSIYWNLTWTIEEVDYTPYTSFSRAQVLFTPEDWNSTFTCYYNATEVFGGKISNGYIVSLDSISSPGVIKLYTTSPNYVQQLLLSDDSSITDTFTLGYWTTDTVDAFGHEGSSIESEVTLKDAVTSGLLNFTVVNPDGLINPLKTSLPSNLLYVDTSEYSISGITSSAPGIFTASTSFDPSVYGTDNPGLWSVFIFWENGSEIGIFSTVIKVEVSTDCDCSWEILPDSDDWTSNSTNTLLRANGDSIEIESYYFTNSEPFFDDFGPTIANASIEYSTSWGASGEFDDVAPFYNTSILASATAGMHTIILSSYNNGTLDKTININLEVFNLYSIEPVNTAIAINSTDEAIIQFRVINETDPAKGAIFPDEFTLTINDNPVTSLHYLYDTEGDLNIISIRMADYGVTSGTVNLGLSISKANFRSGYVQDSASFTFSVTVNPVNGNGEFPTHLIIAIVVPSVVIILSLISYLLATSKSRKLEQPLVDVSDESAVVQLFDSVLSMKKVLFIHSETSLPVFELNVGHEIEVDTALVSGFLVVVARMGKQIGGMHTGDIRKLEYRNFVVNSSSSDVYTLFLFSTEDIIPGILNKLFDLVMWFHYTFAIQGDWDGRIELFQDKRNLVQDKIAETLYLWIYFPLEYNIKKESEIKKIEGLNSKIVNFIQKNKEVTISSILNTFSELHLEETLTTIFKLVNAGVLVRRQFSSFAGKVQ